MKSHPRLSHPRRKSLAPAHLACLDACAAASPTATNPAASLLPARGESDTGSELRVMPGELV